MSAFTPPPIGAYAMNGGVWAPQASPGPAGAQPAFTPPPAGLYSFNSALGQWVPWNGASGGAGGVQVAAAQQLGLTANIPPTLLYAIPAGQGGLYCAIAYNCVTIPGSTSGTLPSGIVIWTDQDSGASVNGSLGATAPANTLGSNNVTGNIQNVKYIRAAPSTNINIQTTGYASVGSPSLTYNSYFRLFYVGA